MNKPIKLFLSIGWLLPAVIAFNYFARWIREIVVPTLKGGDFNQLYDLHGGVRYLDTTLVFTIAAFCWFAIVLFRFALRQVNHPSAN